MYWRYSFWELRDKVKFKLGQESAILLSQHASFVKILESLFPSKDKKPSSTFDDDVTDLGQAPTLEQAVAQINNVFKW